MNEIKMFLEGTMELEDIEFVEEDDFGYHFVGYENGSDEELEITVEHGNRLIIDGEEIDINMPFNVWSI